MPQHSYLDYSGADWTCERGYKKTGAACIALQVPANAHLNNAGDDWECNQPNRKLQDSCTAS
jgi:hypothetical protein